MSVPTEPLFNTTDKAPWWREITSYQWLVLFVAWLGWVFDIMDTALFNFAKQNMFTEILGKQRYLLSGAGYEGQIQTIFLIGWAIGGLIFGIMADKWGRARTLMLTVLLYCCFTGLTALCHTYEQVIFARFLTALGIGGEWAAGAALVAEVFPQDSRKYAAGILQSAAAFGPWLAAVVNLRLAGKDWRLLFLVGILPALVTVLIRFKIKEPERWKRAQEKAPHEAGSLRELFVTPRWRRNALIAAVIGVVGIVGALNTTYWIPNLVSSASLGYSKAAIGIRTSKVTMILHVGTLLGVLIFPLLCDKFGRRNAFLMFFILSPFALAAMTLGGANYHNLLLLAPIAAFFAIGLSAGFALYFPELFPARLRATGSGFCYNTGRIAAAPFPWLVGLLSVHLKSIATGVGLSALIYLIGLLALPFAPETKGKPLPEE